MDTYSLLCRTRCLARDLYVSIAITLFLYTPPAFSQESLSPAIGVWNGFQGHECVVECSNVGEETLSLSLTVRNNQGTNLGSEDFSLKPKETQHFELNDYDTENQYGTYLIEENTGADISGLTCLTAFYRLAAEDAAKDVDYAFVIPVQDPFQGETAGIYNSINPSADSSFPVFNWLSVYNPAEQPFNAEVQVYDQGGQLDESRSFEISALPPGARQDFALGHEQGQVVGLYKIIPESDDQHYGAFLTRYSLSPEETFRFAFPLYPLPGSCSPLSVSASTMGHALNWGELANPTAQAIEVQVELREQTGELLYSVPVLEIAPYAQVHLPLHMYLGQDNVGSLSVRCLDASDPSKGILLQSLFYGHLSSEPSRVEWAYASQPAQTYAQTGDLLVSQTNTYFSAPNWNKFLSLSNQPLELTFAVYSETAQQLAEDTRFIAAGGTFDFGVHEHAGEDAIGFVLSSASTPDAQYSAELIRVFPHQTGEIGYIMHVPSQVLSAEVPSGSLLYVDNDGGDGLVEGCDDLRTVEENDIDHPFCSIQRAVEAVSAGDAILIRGGVYEHVAIAQGEIKVKFENKHGSPGRPITLRNFDNEEVHIVGSGASWQVFWIEDSSYIDVSGFDISNGRYGLRIDNSHHINVDHIVAHHNDGGSANFGFGIFVGGGSEYVNIRKSETFLNGASGILIGHRSGSYAKHVLVEDCLSYDNGLVYHSGEEGQPISWSDQNSGGNVSDVVFRRNIGYGGGTGMGGENGDNALIEDCIIFNTNISQTLNGDGRGVVFKTDGYRDINSVLRGTMIFHVGSRGFEITAGSAGVSGYQNTIIDAYSGWQKGIVGFGSDDGILKNNIVWGNPNSDVKTSSATTLEQMSHNFIGDGYYSPYDPNTKTGNPLLRNPFGTVNTNFPPGTTIEEKLESIRLEVRGILSLEAGSEAIDAGTLIPGYHCARADDDPTDPMSPAANCRHWYGTAPDMGAIEYVPQGT